MKLVWVACSSFCQHSKFSQFSSPQTKILRISKCDSNIPTSYPYPLFSVFFFFFLNFTSLGSECQLCTWWSWAGNSVWRWGNLGNPRLLPHLLPLKAWKSTFTDLTLTHWNTQKATTLLRTSAWTLPRNAVSGWLVYRIVICQFFDLIFSCCSN